MKNKLILVASIIVISLLVFTCAPKSSSGPVVSTLSTKAVPSQESVAKLAWEIEWEKMVEAAKKEGSLMLYISTGGANREPLKGFTQKYGIRAESVSGRGSELDAKILTEQRAGIYLTDLIITGTSSLVSLKPQGIVQVLEPLLIRPDILDPQAWYANKLPWVDRDRTFFSFVAFASNSISVNSDLVKRGEIKGYQDLLDPKWKGKLTMNDPTIPGTGGLCFLMVSKQIMDFDYMRQLAKQEPIILRDQRLQVEWLAQGKYPIAIWPNSAALADFQQAGATILNIDSVEGNYVTSGGGNIAMFKKAPHPKAAQLFVNWLLTSEGQTLFSKEVMLQSARVDVTTDYVDSTKLRKTGVKYFDSSTEEVVLMREESYKTAKEIFGHLMK